MRSFIGLILFTLLLVSCKQQTNGTQAASAAPNYASAQTIGKWDNLSTPLTIKMSTEFSADFTNADLVNGLNPLEQMAKVWNDSVAPTMTFFQIPFPTTTKTGDDGELSTFYDNEMGIYKSHKWYSSISSSAIAITQYYGVVKSNPTLGTYIQYTHADILVNYRDFGSKLSMTGASGFEYDLPTVILHEMGHFIGLHHEDINPSIMYSYYTIKQHVLKTFDSNKIQALYLNNQNYSALSAINRSANALGVPEGTHVKGVIQLMANGKCQHYINGKLVYEHDANAALKIPNNLFIH